MSEKGEGRFCSPFHISPIHQVIEAVRDFAFVNSAFPVVLSFENHCSTLQMKRMADICRSILGNLLLRWVVAVRRCLLLSPSNTALNALQYTAATISTSRTTCHTPSGYRRPAICSTKCSSRTPRAPSLQCVWVERGVDFSTPILTPLPIPSLPLTRAMHWLRPMRRPWPRVASQSRMERQHPQRPNRFVPLVTCSRSPHLSF